MVAQIFLSPQVKRSIIISNKLVYTCTERVKELPGKSQNFIELLLSAQSSS